MKIQLAKLVRQECFENFDKIKATREATANIKYIEKNHLIPAFIESTLGLNVFSNIESFKKKYT